MHRELGGSSGIMFGNWGNAHDCFLDALRFCTRALHEERGEGCEHLRSGWQITDVQLLNLGNLDGESVCVKACEQQLHTSAVPTMS